MRRRVKETKLWSTPLSLHFVVVLRLFNLDEGRVYINTFVFPGLRDGPLQFSHEVGQIQKKIIRSQQKKGGLGIVCNKQWWIQPDIWSYKQGRREGGGNLPRAPNIRGLQLEKYPKIEQGLIKIGASTRH